MSANPPPLPKSVGGFTPIPVAYSPNATHILYARAHSNPKSSKQSTWQASKGKGKEAAYPEGRTLFLVNLPPDATERELTLFFKSAGTVERVVFDADGDLPSGEDELFSGGDSESEDGEDEDGAGAADPAGEPEERPRKKRRAAKDVAPEVVPLPTPNLRTLRRTGRSAHLVFLDSSSLPRALSSSLPSGPGPDPSATAKAKPRPWPIDDAAPHGLAHYRAAYAAARPPLDAVRAHADTYMARFEWAQARGRRASKYRMGEAVVDADGFTLVARGGAYGKALGGGVGVASKRFQDEAAGGKRHRKKKPEKKEKEAFYAFQVREKKRKELMDLKAKWEEDKAKVEKLKQSRRFKPY
ncbi:hypothetical protein DAEQUDRAFT_667907 [Daedalea quercina L-15889]|uniref:RRM domain-containing protein n=1 Tax=Daedalea quercina L-15889 TaxID=1314783 RepID=A0A165R5R7_9APHY|nr:hypothetical protein DAEQUDRAFT_667907 [Daedalea quercina L-15889]